MRIQVAARPIQTMSERCRGSDYRYLKVKGDNAGVYICIDAKVMAELKREAAR